MNNPKPVQLVDDVSEKKVKTTHNNFNKHINISNEER